jgi:hypothetical protein
MFTTDEQVKQDLADALKVDVDDLVSSWSNNVGRCHALAAGEVATILLARGYTSDQIDAWDDGAAWERQLSLWYLSSMPQGQSVFDKVAIDAYDVRKKLACITLRVSAKLIKPDSTDGNVSFGAITTSDYDVFGNPDEIRW